ncbi:serine hydrolase [Flavobacteriaceae bacterium R38]|nr:serine hydrolase [Flavobacteriaceae bacterium R38]
MKITTNLTILIFLLFNSCSTEEKAKVSPTISFNNELQELKDYFQIPGIAVLIKKENQVIYEDYLGNSDVKNHIPIDSTITIPMASLTKIFSGITIMQLEAEGKLSLDDPINKYASSFNIPDSIKIKHILSHTSQGEVGKHFYYSNRFGLLTSVIEKANNQSFEKTIQNRIINKLGLKNTYLLKDSTQLINENRRIAQPYTLGGEIKDGVMEKQTKYGFIDYGFSSSAGIVSTVRDLAILDNALNDNTLITEALKLKMFTPFNAQSSYGLGIFSQEFMGKKLIWGYGQYDCYSSLFLKVPSKNLTFIIAANNNLMSDPARLINGDVTTSLFAMSFLKNFVFSFTDEALFENESSLNTLKTKITDDNTEFFHKKLIAQSLASAYMSRFDSAESEKSKMILKQVFKIFPGSKSKADLNLLFNLQLLNFMDTIRGNPSTSDFDVQYKKIGKALLTIDSDNPYANYYMGNYYLGKGITDNTAFFYDKIVSAKNFSPWWYTEEAKNWLEANK